MANPRAESKETGNPDGPVGFKRCRDEVLLAGGSPIAEGDGAGAKRPPLALEDDIG